jgi:hypothetical protein
LLMEKHSENTAEIKSGIRLKTLFVLSPLPSFLRSPRRPFSYQQQHECLMHVTN